MANTIIKKTKRYLALFLASLLLSATFIPQVIAASNVATGRTLYVSSDNFEYNGSLVIGGTQAEGREEGVFTKPSKDGKATLYWKHDAGGSRITDKLGVINYNDRAAYIEATTANGGAFLEYDFNELITGQVTISFQATGGTGASVNPRWQVLDDQNNVVMFGGVGNNANLGSNAEMECVGCANGTHLKGHNKTDGTSYKKDHMSGNGHSLYPQMGWYKMHLDFDNGIATFEEKFTTSGAEWKTFYGYAADATLSDPYVMALGSTRGAKKIRFNFSGSSAPTSAFIVDSIEIEQTAFGIDRELIAKQEVMITAAKTLSGDLLVAALDTGIDAVSFELATAYSEYNPEQKAYVADYVANHRPTAEELEEALNQLCTTLDTVMEKLNAVNTVKNGGDTELRSFINNYGSLLEADVLDSYNNLSQSQKDSVITMLSVMTRGFYLPQDISIALDYVVNRVLNPTPEGTVIHPVPTFSVVNGAKNVHPDQPLHITFNCPMKSSDMGSIVLTRGVGELIATKTEVSIDGSDVVIIPLKSLEPYTTYTLSVPPHSIRGFNETLGTAVSGAVTFTTGAQEGYFVEENYNNLSAGATMLDVITETNYSAATKVRLDDGDFDINSVSSWNNANAAGQFENGAGLYLRNDGRVDLIEANPKASTANSGNMYYILDIDDVSTGGIHIEFDMELLDTQVGSVDYFFGINNGATYGANGNYWQLGFQNGVLKAYSNGESLTNGALTWTNEAGEAVSENVAGKLVAGKYHISFYADMNTNIGTFVVQKETDDGILIGKRTTAARVPTTNFEACSFLVFKATYQTDGSLYNFTDNEGNKKSRFILDNISTHHTPSAVVASAILTSSGTGVGLYDNQTIRFSTAMTEAGLSGAITLRDPYGKTIPFSGILSEDGLTYTVIPSEAFLYADATYNITIDGAVNWAGQIMTTQTLSFSTVTQAQMVECSIKKNAKDVHPDSQIVLQFGAAMNTENMNAITLKRQNGWEEPFSLQMSHDGSDVVLVPEKGLKPLTSYIITIPGDKIATKADGTIKTVDTVITFTTGRDEGFYLEENYNQHNLSSNVWEIIEGTRYTYWGDSMLNMDSGTYVSSASSYETAKLNGQFDEGAGLYMREDGAIDFIEASVGQGSRYGESVYKLDFQDVENGRLQVEFDLEMPGDQNDTQNVLFSISNKSSMSDSGAYWWLGFENGILHANGRGESSSGVLNWTKADGTTAASSTGKLTQGRYHIRLDANLDTGIGEFTIIKNTTDGQFIGKRTTAPITKMDGFEACDSIIFKSAIGKTVWGTVSLYNCTDASGKRINKYILDNIRTRYSANPDAFVKTENQLIEADGTPVITFNTPMTEAGLSGKVLLKDAGGAVVDFTGVLSDDGYSYTLVPEESLAGNTTYTLTVSSTVDWEGKAMNEKTLSFTTQDAPQVTMTKLKLYAKVADREQSITEIIAGEKVIASAIFTNSSEVDVVDGILYIGVYNVAGKLLKVAVEKIDIPAGDAIQVQTTFVVPEDIGNDGYVKVCAWGETGRQLCDEREWPY